MWCEMKHKASLYLLEWIFASVLASFFWTAVLFKLQGLLPSAATVGTISAFYGSAFVYVRLLQETGCKKCHSLLPFRREEMSRQHVRDEEQCMEVERGGEAWEQHYLDVYARVHRVEIVKFRCRRCHAVWDETQRMPASGYRRVRTIDIGK